ncbi:Bifunctional purine biosynthesis protein PurH [Coemansia thaxteri]|uniref:Bifunctional purine biosynthesis protein PurH n=1 Tax=Coemansia thaxteri TaxID=2663907 RepID=A0A9W8ELR5_9FUNG|nr:Bifunctional purine biosynthesis protein PurH [Coemansia thaxteri]KAJ2477755.1 Bifunctional purine biosynthesis protein PurH [Coemansia sp. RSA 2320]
MGGNGQFVPRVFAVDLHEVDSDKFQDSRESGFSWYIFFTAFLASLSAMSIGWSVGVTGAIKLAICLFQDEDETSAVGEFPKHILFTDSSWSVAAGVLSVGGLFGAIISGAIADRIGRRNTLVINNGFMLAGSVLMGTATTAVHFSLGRFVMGVGCGIASNAVNTYIGEISPAGWRGFYGSFFHFAVMLGILGSQITALFVDKMEWRVVVAIPGIFSVIQIALLPLRVESPSYLIMARHTNEARHALLKLRSGYDVTAEWQECLASLDQSTAARATVSCAMSHSSSARGQRVAPAVASGSLPNSPPNEPNDSEVTIKSASVSRPAQELGNGAACCHSPKALPSLWQTIRGRTRDDLRHLVMCNTILLLLHQINGAYAVLFTDSAMVTLVFDPESPLPTRWACVLACSLALPVVVLCMLKVDTLGRRPMLMASLSGMCIFSVLASAGLFYGPNSLVMAAVLVFFIMFNLGLGAIPWFYMSESIPAYSRSATNVLGCSLSWGLSILVGLLVPVVEQDIPQWLFVIYGGLSLLGLLFVFLCVPETACRPTTDIVKQYAGPAQLVTWRRAGTLNRRLTGART